LLCTLVQLLGVGSETRGQAAQQAAGTIVGRIATEQAGARTPVRRARITLTREGTQQPTITGTDGEGRYRFDGLTPGRYVVAAEKPGFVTSSAPVEVTHTSRTLDLALITGGAIEGTLSDDRNIPIPRLAVTADRLSDAGAVAASYAAAADDLGRFRVHSLPAGRYRVRVPAPASRTEYVFYPGTRTPDDARVIAVTAGATSDRIELVIPFAPSSTADPTDGQTATGASDPKLARIEGTITRSDSAQPIVNALVQLGEATGVFRYRATTGIDGRFELTGVPAGTWVLSALAPGFASLDASVTRPTGAGFRLTVKDGDRAKQDVKLAPVSAIEGRVLDEFGDPSPGVVVQVAQKMAVAGLSRFLTSPSIAATGTTDDRGWFRAPNLFPGDYYLVAVPQPFEKSWMTGFPPTFFPGATAADAATPISVVAGRDVFEVRFAIARARTTTVAGQIVDASGQPVPKSQVVLMPTEGGEVRTMVMARGVPEPDGTFSFTDVPAGTYAVQVMSPGMFGVADITVAENGQAARPVRVVVKGLTTARGRVVFEGDAAPAQDQRTQSMIAFQPTSFTTGPVGSNRIAVAVHPDWRFEIPNLAWHGVLRVNPPAGWALARIRHEGRDITDTPFDFQSADVSGLEVVLTNQLGTVSGTVTSGSQPAANVRVLILGADDTSWTYLSRTTRLGRTDDRGAFSPVALVPGRYLAVPMASDPALGDHSSLITARSLAIPFTVSAGTNTSLNLTIAR